MPHAELEDGKLKFGTDGLSYYTVENLKTDFKYGFNHSKRGKGVKEVQLNHDVPGPHLLHTMSKAWQWIDTQVKVEFHTRTKYKFDKEKRQDFVEAINKHDFLHLRADVLLSALPRTSANIIPPWTDWRKRICWVAFKTNLDDNDKVRKLVHKEQQRLKRQVKIQNGLEEKGLGLPLEDERKSMKDEIKAKGDFGAFMRQREAMFDRIDEEFSLICPIVRRLAPPYAPADQLLYLARNIAWKLPRIKKLFNKSPAVYQKIRATMKIDESKEEVQARIKRLLDKGVKDPELPVPSTNSRPFGAPFTHPFLLGTKKFNPKDECCFRCGKVPCGKDHMKSCYAPPSEWLPKWESVILRDWIVAQRGLSDRVDQDELHQHHVSQPGSNNTFEPGEDQAGAPIPAHYEDKELQNNVLTEASPKANAEDWRKNDGTIDLGAFRDSLEQDLSLGNHKVVRRLGSKDHPNQTTSPFRRVKLKDSETESSSNESINGEACQSPPPRDPDVKTFREELSSNRSQNLETTSSKEDEHVLPFIRKQAAFNPAAFTNPKAGIARAVFVEQGSFVDLSNAPKPKNRGPFQNFNFAGNGEGEAGVGKKNPPNGNGGPENSVLDPIQKEELHHLKWQETFVHRERIQEETRKAKLWEDRLVAMQKENALLKEQLRERQEVWSIPSQDVEDALPCLMASRQADNTRHENPGSSENSHDSTQSEMGEPRTVGAMTVEVLRERIEAKRAQNDKVRRQSNSVTRSLVRTHGGLPGPSFTGVGTIRKRNYKVWGRGVH